jgi:hypothetical protein
MTVNEARIAALQAEITRLEEQLAGAREELTLERFADVPHFGRGDRVLVRRVLFGRPRLWPARIEAVHFNYSSGMTATGQPRESKTVSYSVTHELPDGSGWAAVSSGYWASEVYPMHEQVGQS